MRENSVLCGSSGAQAGGSEIKFAGNDNKDKMYEPKHKRKLVRVLTVIGYIFSVSLAAIMLSLFYVFLYSPGKPSTDNDKVFGISDVSVRREYPILDEDSAHLLNESYLNVEREEPRALPMKKFQTAGEKTNENKTTNQDFIKFSPNIEYENKTSRLLKMLKPVINLD